MEVTLMNGEEQLWLRQFDPKLDFPARDPDILYMACTTPRSGSHFFCHEIRNTSVFGYPLEYPGNFQKWRESLKESNDTGTYYSIKRRRTSINGLFGVKIHYQHLGFMHIVEKKFTTTR
jgi:LPS sulfotransferase NodH